MSTDSHTTASSHTPAEGQLNLVCGSGGTRAMLASNGVFLACHLARIQKWHTIGGASGGAIAASFLAAGLSPVEITHLGLETDFSSLITRHCSLGEAVAALLFKDNVYRIIRPRRGLFSAEKLASFVTGYAKTWPDNFWLTCAVGEKQLLFTAQGIYLYTYDGGSARVAARLPDTGLAVIASAAIPGIFDAVVWCGQKLYDGALTFDGRTPVNVAKRHFRQPPGRVIAVDVGDSPSERTRLGRLVWRVILRLVGGRTVPFEGDTPTGSEGTILIQPDVTSVRSLQFSPTRGQKWQAIMAGFTASIEPLTKAGLLKGAELESATSIAATYAEIVASAKSDDELSRRTEALLASYGLY